MKLNRKGFTLVELLITIVIVGLVIGLSTFGIISLVNNSRSKKNILNEENIKEAAKIYSTEVGNKSWKSNDDYDVFWFKEYGFWGEVLKVGDVLQAGETKEIVLVYKLKELTEYMLFPVKMVLLYICVLFYISLSALCG